MKESIRNLLKEPNVWIGSIITIVALVALILALTAPSCTDTQDLGLMQRPGRDGLVTLKPILLPIGLIANETVDERRLQEAISKFNSQVGRSVVLATVDPETYRREIDFRPPGIITLCYVSIEEIASNRLEEVDILYDKKTGEIYRGVIKMNHQHAYNDKMFILSLMHAIGHCLGLEDDTNSLKINSLMSRPLLPTGKLTEKDKNLILKMF